MSWFKGGAEFSPKVKVGDYRRYVDGRSKVKILLDELELRVRLLSEVLGRELPEGERQAFELTLPQANEAWELVQCECFPTPRLCANCAEELDEEDPEEEEPSSPTT